MTDMSTSTAATPQVKLTFERIYTARVEELWELWTTKAGFESWWGPEGFRVEVHTLEARAGGPIEYDMIADAPDAIAAMKRIGQPLSHATRGWFAQFRPIEHLTLMHMIDFISGLEPYESMIEVDFHAAGERSRMMVTLHPHRDPHWTDMAAKGFGSQLTKLDKRFSPGG